MRRMKSKGVKGLLLVAMVLALFITCGCGADQVTTRSDFALDTVVSITIYGQKDDALLNAPFEVIYDLNNRLDAFSTESEIGQINAAAGQSAVEVSEDTFQLISTALTYSDITEGAFDISAGPLVDLWGIGEPEIREAPDADSVAQARASVNYHGVVLNPDDLSVYLTSPGMKLNLGAVAKGYIGEAVKAALVDEGVTHAIVNLGGNVVLIGGKTNRESFSVGVEDPCDPEGAPIGVLKLKDKAVVTSGDYQRYFTDANGKRYHHILDATTGYPAEGDLHQVTVVCDDSGQADALSTSLFLMGSTAAQDYIDATDGVEGILVTTEKQVIVSKGLKKYFTFDESGNAGEYTLVQ